MTMLLAWMPSLLDLARPANADPLESAVILDATNIVAGPCVLCSAVYSCVLVEVHLLHARLSLFSDGRVLPFLWLSPDSLHSDFRIFLIFRFYSGPGADARGAFSEVGAFYPGPKSAIAIGGAAIGCWLLVDGKGESIRDALWHDCVTEKIHRQKTKGIT